MKNGRLSDRVESFREVDINKNRPRVRLWFVLNPSEMDRERNRTWSRVDRLGQKLAWRGERMELDSRKKSRRDRMMRSKNAGDERDRPEGSRRVERLSYFIDVNNRRCFPDGRKGM